MNINIKPKVFIGSSSKTESLAIAKLIKKNVSPFADCVLWTTHFDNNKSYLATLEGKLALFDYGIFIGTADDLKVQNENSKPTGNNELKVKIIRDNVLFEFGMFLGRLGSDKSYILIEKGVDIPSDLGGVKLLKFESKNENTTSKTQKGLSESQRLSVTKLCDKINRKIKSDKKIFKISLFPSTSLAYGYYKNFLRNTVEKLLFAKTVYRIIENKNQEGEVTYIHEPIKFKTAKFTIYIPDNLTSNMYDKVTVLKDMKKLTTVAVDAEHKRPYDFFTKLNMSKSGRSIGLYDLPLTLNALYESVQDYLKKYYVGEKNAEKYIEEREILNFYKTLNALIKENSITRKTVVIEWVNL